MILFFKKKSKKSKKSGIELGAQYFVDGNDVVFDLNDLEFTFEKFYVKVGENDLQIIIKDEVPMNLINILATVNINIDVNRKEILDSDIVHFTLKLNEIIYKIHKSQIFNLSDVKEVFNLSPDKEYPLRRFNNYYLESYGTKTEL
jgi:hypothetical protein